MIGRKWILLLLLVPGVFLFAGGSGDSKMPAIRVGSKIDTEGALLGNIMVLLLEDAGYEVEDKTELGVTDVVRRALEAREIDIYPEYTGNGKWFFQVSEFEDEWFDAEGALSAVRELDGKENNIQWLEPAPANNTWAIAVREDLAQAEGLETMTDFAVYVNRGGEVKLAGSEEFVSGRAGLRSFETAYGFKLDEDQLVVVASGNTTFTEQAAARGTDGVNFAMAYGTDGQLAALGLVVMRDDKSTQIVYQPAPRVSAHVLEQYPEIPGILEPVFMSLYLETLQELNASISVDGLPVRQVAGQWLKENGFIG